MPLDGFNWPRNTHDQPIDLLAERLSERKSERKLGARGSFWKRQSSVVDLLLAVGGLKFRKGDREKIASTLDGSKAASQPKWRR